MKMNIGVILKKFEANDCYHFFSLIEVMKIFVVE